MLTQVPLNLNVLETTCVLGLLEHLELRVVLGVALELGFLSHLFVVLNRKTWNFCHLAALGSILLSVTYFASLRHVWIIESTRLVVLALHYKISKKSLLFMLNMNISVRRNQVARNPRRV